MSQEAVPTFEARESMINGIGNDDCHATKLAQSTKNDLKDILVLPNPEEKPSKRKGKPKGKRGINKSTVCTADGPVLRDLKDKEQEKR